MKIQTKYHGEVHVEEKDIITFEYAIPGFGEEKSFAILPFSDDSIFSILQSTKSAGVAFVLADPFVFFQDYDFTLEDQVVEQLKLTYEKDVAVRVILTIQEPFEKTTANLQAPVVINTAKQLGRQVILTNTNYQTKHGIFQGKKEKVKEEV
ncbi:flagellar assembly protein FliW [Bacillus timonensis]|nr:flagellar assembly protein FliW [Bacillus timonensis]